MAHVRQKIDNGTGYLFIQRASAGTIKVFFASEEEFPFSQMAFFGAYLSIELALLPALKTVVKRREI